MASIDGKVSDVDPAETQPSCLLLNQSNKQPNEQHHSSLPTGGATDNMKKGAVAIDCPTPIGKGLRRAANCRASGLPAGAIPMTSPPLKRKGLGRVRAGTREKKTSNNGDRVSSKRSTSSMLSPLEEQPPSTEADVQLSQVQPTSKRISHGEVD